MDEQTTVQEVVDTVIEKQGEALPVSAPVEIYPTRRGYLMCKCGCGELTRISDEVIEDGLSWSMIIGSEHYLTLYCSKCEARLTMYIEETTEENDLSEKSTEE